MTFCLFKDNIVLICLSIVLAHVFLSVHIPPLTMNERNKHVEPYIAS